VHELDADENEIIMAEPHFLLLPFGLTASCSINWRIVSGIEAACP
jgi:hypothetical protein